MSKEDDYIARINELEAENIEYRKWRDNINVLLQQMMDMLTKLSENDKDSKIEFNRLWEYAMINRYRIDSLPFELMDPDYKSFFINQRYCQKAKP